MEYERVKRFAIDVLGCGCDNSVFNRIDHDRNYRLPSGITLSSRILIGARLLIYVIDRDFASPADLKSVVLDGLEERNSRGYNRLRVVLTTDSPESDLQKYSRIFNEIPSRDEKTHLHVIRRSESI